MKQALWSGHEVVAEHEYDHEMYRIKVAEGVKGFNVPVEAVVIDGVWRVWHHGNALNVIEVTKIYESNQDGGVGPTTNENDICDCLCHKPGMQAMHIMACCNLCPCCNKNIKHSAYARHVKECARTHPLRLSVGNYWQELERMGQCGQLPRGLAEEMKALVSSFLHNTISSQVSSDAIVAAKEYLRAGIVLIDGEVENRYTIMVFVPNEGKEQEVRTFFCLVPGYQNGKLRYL